MYAVRPLDGMRQQNPRYMNLDLDYLYRQACQDPPHCENPSSRMSCSIIRDAAKYSAGHNLWLCIPKFKVIPQVQMQWHGLARHEGFARSSRTGL